MIDELAPKLLTADVLPAENKILTESMHELLDSPKAALTELRRMHEDPAFDYPMTHMVIPVYASYFGDHELALEAFQEASTTRFIAPSLLWRPIHKEMRQLPNFKHLVRDLGLVDYWRSTGKWGDFCRPIGNDDFECT